MATRSLSRTFTRTVGSTLATITPSPTFISSRISEPSCSITSITASKQGWSRSAAPATVRSSGRTPSVTSWPIWPRRRRAVSSGSLMRKPEFSAISDPFASVTVTAAKFMAGEPMNPATNLLAAGELARLARQQFADAEDVGRLPHAPVNLALFEFAHLQAERHVVIHAHMRVERVVLEHHGDVSVHRRQFIDHVAVD